MRGDPRTCRCVCGGTIEAPDGDWGAIAEAVRGHQRTPLHVAWRIGTTVTRAATVPADWHYRRGRRVA